MLEEESAVAVAAALANADRHGQYGKWVREQIPQIKYYFEI